ncbi:MAG: tetratricopeptide repeat protein [Planctomycetota bacterium]|nr:tetratricopeptide repeat protein [Planctomycetota bacterium]
MDQLQTNEQFIRFALQHSLLTDEEARRCRDAVRESGRSATEVVLSLNMLKPAQIETLLDAMRKAPSVLPLVRDAHPLNLDDEFAPLIEEVVAAEGQLINRRYRIVRLLGEGGMGRVYLAVDTLSDDRQIALKTIQKESVSTMLLDEKPENEFKLLAGLRHPNVEIVYDFGRIQEGPDPLRESYFFTCELLSGKDLLFATADMTWQEMVPLIVQLCRGLQFIHTHDLVHFDVKPENVLVCAEDHVKLVDFGASRAKRSIQGTPAVIGTVPYISPEVLRYDAVDHRADLYGLGVTMYELFARVLPYDSDSKTRVMTDHLEAPIPRVRKAVPGLPQEIEDLITRLMAKYPAQRPPSANEVIKALSRITGVEYELETKETLKGYVSSGEFVGREPESAWLRSLWQRAEKKEKGVRIAIISGESGIGKSRLAREFRIWAQTQQVAVAEGKANEGAPEPFGLAQEVFEKAVRQVEVWEHTGGAQPGLIRAYAPYLKEIVPALAEQYRPAEPPALGPEQARIRLLDKASEFVLKGTKEKGMILVFDDIQWADEMSLRLLEFLGRRAGLGVETGKVFIVATKREGEETEDLKKILDRLVSEGHAEERVLKALSRDQQDRFIRTMFGDEAGVLKEKILAVEESGNPLFLEEVLRGWVDEQVLKWRPWGWEVDRKRWKGTALPDSVKEVIARRIRRLGRTERGWLDRLAVWGKAVREDEIDLLLTSKKKTARPARPDLRDLIERGLLRHEPSGDVMTYRFAHDRVREMSWQAMNSDRRRRLSLDLLLRLESEILEGRRRKGEDVERLARLAWDAGAKDKYAKYGEDAARDAARRHSPAEALDAYRRLLETELAPGKRIDVLERMGLICTTLGRLAEAETVFKDALARAVEMWKTDVVPDSAAATGNPSARLESRLASTYFRMGRFDDSEERLERSLQRIRSAGPGAADPLEHARTLIIYGWFKAKLRSRIAEGEELIRQGIELARTQGDAGEELTLEGLEQLSEVASLRDDHTDNVEGCTARLRYYERTGDKQGQVTALNNLGSRHVNVGEILQGEELLTRALKICEEIGDKWRMALVLRNLGEALRNKGELDRAAECCEQSISIAEEMGERRMLALALSEAANVYRLQGRFEQALKLYARATSIFREIGDERCVARAFCDVGDVYCDIGELDHALENYGKCKALCERLDHKVGLRMVACSMALALQEKGDLDGALKALRERVEKPGIVGRKTETRLMSSALASVLLARCEFEKAHLACDSALVAARELGAELARVGDATVKAATLRRQGRCKEALVMARDALRAADQAGLPAALRGRIRLEICLDAVELGDNETAAQTLEQAERLIGDGAAFRVKVDLAAARARFEAAFGDKTAAHVLYNETIGTLRGKGYVLRARELEEELRRLA